MICQHKVFLHLSKNRIPDPSENRALEFKGEFRRFGICSVSTTIGTNRAIFFSDGRQGIDAAAPKKDRHEAIHDRITSSGTHLFAKL
ncbi:MAG TPA: hypothetical protein VIY51_14750 [Xanthobacteraceae bacterium]